MTLHGFAAHHRIGTEVTEHHREIRSVSREEGEAEIMDLARTEEFPVLVHWQQPRCLIGMGAHELAGPSAAGMGLKHVLFVTSGLKGTGIIDELKGQFEAEGVAVTVYDKVESNPKDYNVMDAYRRLDLRKAPSIGETLDWAQALVVLGAPSLSRELIEETLSVVIKYDGDAAKVRRALAGETEPHAHGHSHSHSH
jgi:Iron-containing alcohol dehydrogenase